MMKVMLHYLGCLKLCTGIRWIAFAVFQFVLRRQSFADLSGIVEIKDDFPGAFKWIAVEFPLILADRSCWSK